MTLFNLFAKRALLFMLWFAKHVEPWCCASTEYTLTRFDDQFLLVLTFTDRSGARQTVESIGNALDIHRAIQRVEARLVLEGGET